MPRQQAPDSPESRTDRMGLAILLGIAAAVACYFPAAILYDAIRTRLSPMQHAEEAMGRGLEVMFFGGPLGAVLLAVLAGVVTYRGHVTPAATTAAIAIAAVASVAIVTYLPL